MKGLYSTLRFALAVIALFPAMHGCYYYVPVDTSASPPVGERLALDITDRGRAELAERLGPGVIRLEGTLTQFDTNDYVLRVWELSQIARGSVRWSGESVRINRDFVGLVQQRQLSQQRTWLLVGGVLAGVTWFGLTQDLLGGGAQGGKDPEPPPPTDSRGWWPRLVVR